MRFTDFDAILFDMDGTLYREEHALPGAAALIDLIRQKKIPLACVTNNSANTSDQLSQRLARMGVVIEPAMIYTSCHAMVDYILAHWPRPRVFNFAGDALKIELAGRAEFVERMEQPCDAVAVGTHFRENGVPFDFESSLVGLNLLKRGATLVVGSADRVFPIHGGGVEFGSGSWGALFAYATNQPADRIQFTGKPEPEFFHLLCRRLNVDPKRCLIVGDNLESDIKGGLAVDMATALVMTGITTKAELERSAIRPGVVFEGLPELMEAMK